MGWIGTLLIIAGISLDIFATMECQGSLVRQVNKKHLAFVSVIGVLWQLAILFVGYYSSDFICRKNPTSNEALLGEIVAVVIFFCLGCRLLIKAIKNERVYEHLVQKFDTRRMLQIAGATCFYTLLAGIAFGFLQTNILIVLVMIAFITVLCIVAGVYTGYHFGFEQKNKVYILGTLCLWGAGGEVLIRYIL
ncbi:MAG: manganese efflux pump [Bacteroidales bacterium]|nr:manganese efflux pump [Bacteroidales bacterium]